VIFLIFGFPGDDRRGACLQAEKWEHTISYSMLYLGFLINSRGITVSWPYYKRAELYRKLEEILQQRANNVTISPRTMASVIGKLRSAISISPWGTYLSFSMSTHLTQASQNAFRATRSWWSKAKIRVNKTVIRDMRLLMEALLAPEEDPIWTHPIALLVPREAMHWFKSNASYAGIGGWTLNFGALIWRVTQEDPVILGFNMKTIGPKTDEPTDPSKPGSHINPLEFLAAIIDLWLALKLISLEPILCQTGYILDLISDNTTCLSWTHVAATTPNPALQQMAHFASALLVQAARLLTRVQPSHLAGILNEEADTLSWRLKSGQVPSWEHVTLQHSQLQTCRICLLPRKLLSTLAKKLSLPQTEVTFNLVTTDLLTLDLNFLPAGLPAKGLTSSLQLP
jgi:hypothetical protein